MTYYLNKVFTFLSIEVQFFYIYSYILLYIFCYSKSNPRSLVSYFSAKANNFANMSRFPPPTCQFAVGPRLPGTQKAKPFSMKICKELALINVRLPVGQFSLPTDFPLFFSASSPLTICGLVFGRNLSVFV